MKRMTVLLMTLVLFASTGLKAQDTGDPQEVAAVKAVIESAYVQGIHIERNLDKIKAGFHPDFTMLILRDGQMSKMTIQEWMERIEKSKERNPDPPAAKVTHRFSMVNVEGTAAAVRIEIYRDDKHIFTDYMALYKFADGWKIVNKIYYTQPK